MEKEKTGFVNNVNDASKVVLIKGGKTAKDESLKETTPIKKTGGNGNENKA